MILEKFNPKLPASDDGFPIERGTLWTFQKNKIIHHFLHDFTATMRRKFNYLVYLDLFAGSGIINLGKKGFTHGAPVIALSEQNGFSKHIFCESNTNFADALRIRVNKYYRDKNSLIFNGNPNELIDKLVYYIPDSSEKYKVSTFCLIDPFSMDLDFETVRMLSELGMNFLVVMALPWSDKNHYKIYLDEEREKLNSYLGMPWSLVENDQSIDDNEVFFRLLIKNYHQNLKGLGYEGEGSFYPIDEHTHTEVPFFFVGYYRHTNTLKNIQPNPTKNKSTQVDLFNTSPAVDTSDSSF